MVGIRWLKRIIVSFNVFVTSICTWKDAPYPPGRKIQFLNLLSTFLCDFEISTRTQVPLTRLAQENYKFCTTLKSRLAHKYFWHDSRKKTMGHPTDHVRTYTHATSSCRTTTEKSTYKNKIEAHQVRQFRLVGYRIDDHFFATFDLRALRTKKAIHDTPTACLRAESGCYNGF